MCGVCVWRLCIDSLGCNLTAQWLQHTCSLRLFHLFGALARIQRSRFMENIWRHRRWDWQLVCRYRHLFLVFFWHNLISSFDAYEWCDWLDLVTHAPLLSLALTSKVLQLLSAAHTSYCYQSKLCWFRIFFVWAGCTVHSKGHRWYRILSNMMRRL